MKTHWMILIWSTILTGCDETIDDTAVVTDDTGEVTSDVVSMVVDNHLLLCSGEGQWLCPQVQIDGGDWEPLGCGVDGLDYLWGTTYTITAEKTGFSDPAMDGCGDIYALVSVEAEAFDGADRAFSFDWVYDTMITADGSGGGDLQGTAFVCIDDAVCETVAAVTPDWQDTYSLALQNPSKVGEPLVLTAITLNE